MKNFQGAFETCKRSFISAFSIYMNVPLKEVKISYFKGLIM